MATTPPPLPPLPSTPAADRTLPHARTTARHTIPTLPATPLPATTGASPRSGAGWAVATIADLRHQLARQVQMTQGMIRALADAEAEITQLKRRVRDADSKLRRLERRYGED